MKKTTVALVGVMCLLAVGSVNATTYTTGFDSGMDGWVDYGTTSWSATGGQDGGGYLYGVRSGNGPYLSPPPDSVLMGNVADNFGGESINYSYYLKDISGNSGNISVYMFSDTDGTPGWDVKWMWTPPDATPPSDWTNYSFTVNPSAATPSTGWYVAIDNSGGAGTWANSWQNVVSWNFYGDLLTSGTHINGIDTVVVASVPTPPPVPKQIGHHHQLFVDDFMIENTSNVNLTLHQPVKHSVGGVTTPVMVADRPWEQGICMFGTTIHDEQEQIYKMWYVAESSTHLTNRVCYATSTDGVNWTKPNLGLSSYGGSTDNNICSGFESLYAASFGVIKDLDDPDPDRRYKLFSYSYHTGDRFCAMVSPDGVDWSGPTNPMIHHSGDVVSMYYDEGLGKYVGLTKRYINGKRSRLITFSDDFVNWTSPQVIMTPDAQDPSTAHLYSHVGYEYEGMRIGYVSVLDTATEKMDTQLVTSRDGIFWQRYRDRIPFIPLGGVGDFDTGMVIAGSSGLVADDEKISIYYGGYNVDHNGNVINPGETPSHPVGLAELRKDGFVSADAGTEGGTLETVAFILPGQELLLNAVTSSSGSIRVALLDGEGYLIDGYGLSDSSVFSGDSLGASIRWNGQAIDEAMLGQSVRLEFEIVDASLYSFWFTSALVPGDANTDGVVNDADASILAAHWQQTGENISWGDGDFNGDNIVNDADASILAAHWQESQEGATAVPEPSTLVTLSGMMVLAGLGVLLHRRR